MYSIILYHKKLRITGSIINICILLVKNRSKYLTTHLKFDFCTCNAQELCTNIRNLVLWNQKCILSLNYIMYKTKKYKSIKKK